MSTVTPQTTAAGQPLTVESSRRPKSSGRLVVGSISVLIFFLVWQGVSWLNLADATLISSPLRVLRAILELLLSGALLINLWISVQEFLLGMAFALIIGVFLGLAMGWYRRLGLLLDPLIMTFYTMPRDALLPIIIIWAGIGLYSKAAVVFLGAVFPIVVNTVTGIREADPSWLKAARSYGAGERDIFWKILLPGCLPYLMAGIRLGIGRGVIGVIIAEMYVSNMGLGALIMRAQVGLNSDALIGLVLLTAMFGFLVVKLARGIENKVGRWRQEV